jgi:hypothetical protein
MQFQASPQWDPRQLAEQKRRQEEEYRRAEAERQRRLAEEQAWLAKEHERLHAIEKALKSLPFATGKTERAAVQKLKVHFQAPESLTCEDREKINELETFLRISSNGQQLQAALTVYKTVEGAVIHVRNSNGEGVFIEIPAPIDPVEVARQLMIALRKGLDTAVGDADPLTIFNGECRELNFKRIFEKRTVLRTLKTNAGDIAPRVAALREMPPLTRENTAILDGIPADAEETRRVMGNDTYAPEWMKISREWTKATDSAGFSKIQGTREQALQALASKKNVIMLVAHANSTELRLPAPPPTGSSIEVHDLAEISGKILENAPVIYMYCCESARFDGLRNWATELLRLGATAVYAPQDKIDARHTRALYEKFLTLGQKENPLSALHQAEIKSGCRELEMWIG